MFLDFNRDLLYLVLFHSEFVLDEAKVTFKVNFIKGVPMPVEMQVTIMLSYIYFNVFPCHIRIIHIMPMGFLSCLC